MFQDRYNRKSGASAEQNLNKTDDPNYEIDTHNLGFKESQGMAVRSKHSTLTLQKVRQVYFMTRSGGDPLKIIMGVPNAKDQVNLLMYQKYRCMGIDRPTVHTRNRVDSETRNNVIADYASGMKVKVICEKYHVSDSVVYHNGVISRKPPVRTPEMKEEVLKMYNEGKTCNVIANHFEVHHNVIRLIILKAHPEMKSLSNKPFVRLTQEKTDEILTLFNNGMIIGNIAKLTGHSKTTVERIVGHIPTKSYKKNDAELLDVIHTCWTLGESLSATAKKLNRPKSTVKFHFDKFKRGIFPS